MNVLKEQAIHLLRSLIKVQSYSGEEKGTADIIQSFLEDHKIPTNRLHNNIIAQNKQFSDSKPTVALNSHHDTVKVVEGWTYDPFGAASNEGKVFGLGSNDAGASLVSLIALFIAYYSEPLPFNLVLVASGEEENFGLNGVSSVLKNGLSPDLGIIGEPTEMKMAIAEKGLMVIDAYTKGEAGHAARDLGINALYLATEDIQWIRNYSFEHVSDVLGPVKTTVTQIEAGYQHNVIPDMCHFVIDARINECYTLEEVLNTLQEGTHADLTSRSMRWHPSGISKDHPIVRKGIEEGLDLFGSPTLSDQVHFSCPTIKIGPGRSERSHTANEYIEIKEISEGIDTYIRLLRGLKI